jgi:hypothetical protein
MYAHLDKVVCVHVPELAYIRLWNSGGLTSVLNKRPVVQENCIYFDAK